MIVLHKEIKLNGEWQHASTLTFAEEDVWDMVSRDGDIFRRNYTPVTELDIEFHQPASPVRHWNKASLLSVCDKIGERKFSKLFGFWPWDSIEMFKDSQDTNQLVTDYGITDIRMVGWYC